MPVSSIFFAPNAERNEGGCEPVAVEVPEEVAGAGVEGLPKRLVMLGSVGPAGVAVGVASVGLGGIAKNFEGAGIVDEIGCDVA